MLGNAVALAGFVSAAGTQRTHRSRELSFSGSALKKLDLFDTAIGRLNTRLTALESLPGAVDVLTRQPSASILASTALTKMDLFGTRAARLSTQVTALDCLAEAVDALARRTWASTFASSALERLSQHGTRSTRLAGLGITGSGPTSPSLRLPGFDPLGEAMATGWNRGSGLPAPLRGLPEEFLKSLRSVTRLLEHLETPIVWAARMAMNAYRRGDHGPMRELLYTHLHIRPATEDHAQALALALLLREWETQVDLSDADAVRAALRQCAREGNDLDGDHKVKGRWIGHLEEGIEMPSPGPGPEDLAIASTVSWSDHFDNRDVRYATGRLKDAEQNVARAWAENGPVNWQEAPLLVGQDVAMGNRVRRRLHRLGDEIVARAKARTPGVN
ncbi:hypothetical protein STRAU_5473 [Streptomyces aurantiacus JA 4570]|uniref:Uncharacterized protein n=1 Tax=Streptomyces aurantiacus JA 4570 TaxID=1286094 RepID=S3ZFQ2_9ACTN|nr:hypothetical protein STRAU_5473 [Streptomyces aurantiacus JA 4570]